MPPVRPAFRSARRPILLGLTLVLFLGGCAHYRLGPGEAPLGFSTLYVAPITNDTALPQAVAAVSRELRVALLRDGRVVLAAEPTAADAVLEVALTHFGRDFTAVQPDDTALARKFDLELTARCALIDQRTGKALFTNRTITVTRQIFVDDGQNPAEYQAVPQLADQLAGWVAHAVLDVW